MDDFAGAILRASGLFNGFTAQKAKDGDITIAECDQIIGELEDIKAAVETYKAKLEAAYEDAGGADSKNDTDRARKVATPESAAEYVDKLKV